MGIQKNNTLILANKNFVSIEKKAIKLIKIIIKDKKYFIPIYLLKFNDA